MHAQAMDLLCIVGIFVLTLVRFPVMCSQTYSRIVMPQRSPLVWRGFVGNGNNIPKPMICGNIFVEQPLAFR